MRIDSDGHEIPDDLEDYLESMERQESDASEVFDRAWNGPDLHKMKVTKNKAQDVE